MRQKSEKIFFIIYMLGFLVMALSIALFQPLADTPPLYPNPPDEHARYLVAKYICEHGVIPTGFEEEIRIPGYGFSYARLWLLSARAERNSPEIQTII